MLTVRKTKDRENEAVEEKWGGITFTDIGKEIRYTTELCKKTNLKISFITSKSNGKILASRNMNNEK
jgi:hypothetical protein